MPVEFNATNPEHRKIGPFLVEGKLGEGGMGIVYKATYTKTGHSVALKILTPALSADAKLLARFEREMSILKKLNDPHIVKYYGSGKYKSQQYYAMELVNGGTVESELARHGRIPWERVVEYGQQICGALQHSHDLGVIHRDLKPANLFLTKEGMIKLGDFGIARDTQDTALTSAGRTVGTYAYMSPEQIIGKPPVSRKTDLYALGCVLYEMLTGRVPFEARNQADMFMMHLNDPPPSLRKTAIECPVFLEQLIMRLLEKNPEDRHYDALAVQQALAEVPKKVAEAQSVSGQTARGDISVQTSQADREELRKALGKDKKKKKKEPFYEQVWFLALCLTLLVAGIVWAAWPMSEAEMFEKIQAGMEQEDPEIWRHTREKLLLPYREKFPDGAHIGEVEDYITRVDLHNLQTRLSKRGPETPYEREYAKADEFAQFGDYHSALELFSAVKDVYGDNPDAEMVVKLAEKRQREINDKIDASDDRVKPLEDALKRAAEHESKGEGAQARKIWRSLITLYQDRPEFAPQVKEARERLGG